MRELWERVISGLLMLAAVAMAATLVHREFFSRQNSGPGMPKAEFVADWRGMLPTGKLVGDTNAPVVIVEFSDLQCPYCRRFHEAVRRIQQARAGQVSYSFIHYPLGGHSQAKAAAYAAECANAAGKFVDAVDFIFSHQDSLGRRSWEWFASGAGVQNTSSFNRCMADTSAVVPAVQSGIALGKTIGVVGTPTVILNGWRYADVPSDTELSRAIDDILAGRKPYKGFPAKGLKAH